MSIGNLILGVNSVTVSYLIRYGSLLQNKTDIITKCDSLITKCDSFCKLQQLYYKMPKLLQNARFITNFDSTNLLDNTPNLNLRQKIGSK